MHEWMDLQEARAAEKLKAAQEVSDGLRRQLLAAHHDLARIRDAATRVCEEATVIGESAMHVSVTRYAVGLLRQAIRAVR